RSESQRERSGAWARAGGGAAACAHAESMRTAKASATRCLTPPPYGRAGAGRSTRGSPAGWAPRTRAGGQRPRSPALRVARLVELDREAAGHLEVRHEPVALLLHGTGELDALRLPLRDRLLDVV